MVTKKETLIPPPGFKSPAPATARQSTSKFPLSAEVVGDGDDEQSDHVSTTSTSSGSDGEDETESQESSTSLEATSNRFVYAYAPSPSRSMLTSGTTGMKACQAQRQ